MIGKFQAKSPDAAREIAFRRIHDVGAPTGRQTHHSRSFEHREPTEFCFEHRGNRRTFCSRDNRREEFAGQTIFGSACFATKHRQRTVSSWYFVDSASSRLSWNALLRTSNFLLIWSWSRHRAIQACTLMPCCRITLTSKSEDKLEATFGEENSHKIVVYANPFKFEVYSGDTLVITANGRGLMKFEHYRQREQKKWVPKLRENNIMSFWMLLSSQGRFQCRLLSIYFCSLFSQCRWKI